MNELLYQSDGPHTTEVYKILKQTLIKYADKNHIKLLPFQVDLIIHKVIKNYIAKNIDKFKRYFLPWGSYSSYYTFTHNELLENGKKEIKIQTDARKKIIKFIDNSLWLMDRLYRPPSKDYCKGLRYKNVKTHFESIVSK